ncbi:CheY-like receiver domain and winged-helix DNA-binding domain containing response regulator [Desulfocurvibacter africanus PCS]|uniref:CheY-like receiver domain and winged-helix DNA-binding domain containing response regulator n=1 Tax=Desulfocurvibacter africanus PCS TaxID=1262666 RepID=M5Q1U1_DESAF|nr:response regulator [Desulfocurvibacter africanus]EMG36848.1 CheY-like receiver domain and winged-helix DNA-binding domain containing response regulator [Desulfocurvibacter africanus PCS]
MSDKPVCFVIEDEPIYVAIITEVLEKMNYQTVAAHSEKEAMSLLPRIDPALIVVDMHLHGRPRGLEIIRIIRGRSKRLGSVPIIGVSAADLCDLRPAGGNAEMNAFVSKLHLVQGLAEAVQKVA